MATPCNVVAYQRADGPANMALDEAMLDAVAEDPRRAYFRTYGWTVPTLSLGYFQRLADAGPAWGSVPIVRRPTGGGALWHDREITYAVVLPRQHPLARESRTFYRAVHDALAALLREHGIDAARRGEPAAAGPDPSQPFLCFTGRDPDDIVAGAAKLVGSAQRRRAGAVLQHGALLLARSPQTPMLAGVEDLTREVRPEAYWCEQMEGRILTALGLGPGHDPPGAELTGRARSLEAAVYRDPRWLARR